MIAVSFFQRDPSGFYTPDFVFSNYARFLSLFFGKVLGFSLVLAVMVVMEVLGFMSIRRITRIDA